MLCNTVRYRGNGAPTHKATRMTGFYWRLPLIVQQHGILPESKSRRQISHLSSKEGISDGGSGCCCYRSAAHNLQTSKKICFIIVPTLSCLKGSLRNDICRQTIWKAVFYSRITFRQRAECAS